MSFREWVLFMFIAFLIWDLGSTLIKIIGDIKFRKMDHDKALDEANDYIKILEKKVGKNE